jgi:hypothetical protein
MYFTGILLVISAGVMKAQDQVKPMSDIPGFRSKLEEMSRAVQSISCDFVQEKSLVVLSEKIISKGVFFFF